VVCKALFRKVIAVFALSLGLIIVLGAAGCSDGRLPSASTPSSATTTEVADTSAMSTSSSSSTSTTTLAVSIITPDLILRLLPVGTPPSDTAQAKVIAFGTFEEWAAAIIFVTNPGVVLFRWEGAGWVKDSEFSYAVVDGPQIDILPQGLPQSLLAWLSAESWVKPWDGESYTTSSIVPSADGSFMSLAPEDLVSAVVEIPAYPDKGDTRRIALDLEKAEGRTKVVGLVNSLRLSSEPAVEPLARISLHVTLVGGREFYVIRFDGCPLLFKDFKDGEIVTYEAVESAEMSAFLAGYR
jgi:hypothetical protein